MTHLPCALHGAALAAAFVSGALLGPLLLPAAVRAGVAAADWLTGRIDIGRVL